MLTHTHVRDYARSMTERFTTDPRGFRMFTVRPHHSAFAVVDAHGGLVRILGTKADADSLAQHMNSGRTYSTWNAR